MTSPTKAKPVANRSSDTKQGEGWWMASDRRWYPPELHPSYKKPAGTGAAAKSAQSATAASKPAAAKTAPAAAKATQPATSAKTAPAEAQTTAKATKPAGDQIQIKQATPTPRAATPTKPAQTNFQTPPAAPTSAPAHASSGATGETAVVDEEESDNPNFVAGVFAGIGALLAMIGSFLTWAVNTGQDIAGGPYDVSFSGFDSSGKGVLFFGILMLIFASLLVLGVKPGWIFGLLAFACGACIIGVVLYSYLDITGKASDGWVREVADESGLPRADVLAAGVGLQSSIGLWIAGVGGLLGLLTPPFLRRDAEGTVDA